LKLHARKIVIELMLSGGCWTSACFGANPLTNFLGIVCPAPFY
jgi:hypothetical protein